MIDWQYDPPHDESTQRNTDALVKKWTGRKPVFFRCLPEMAIWLQKAFCLAGHTGVLSTRCIQSREYEPFTKVKYSALKTPILFGLAEELEEVSLRYSLLWTLNTYLRLVLQYANLIGTANAQKPSDLLLKKKLRYKLEKCGLYHVSPPDFRDGDPEEAILDQKADKIINGLREAIENSKVPFSAIIEQVQYELDPIDYTSLTQAVDPDTAEPLVAASRANLNCSDKSTNDFLKSNKRFNREFLVWFCIAYVEVSLAAMNDPDMGPGRVTNWTVYEKMQELNGGCHIEPIGQYENAIEKERKKIVTTRISQCKAHLKRYSLPVPKNNVLNRDEAVQCIQFFRSIPEISKYFARASFLQQFLNEDDRRKSKN